MLKEAICYNIEKRGEIKIICLPLENYFNFGLIHYRRFYSVGGMISLYNHEKWMEFSFKEKQLYSTVLHEKLKNLQDKNTLIYLWPLEPLNDVIYQGLYNHDLWNGITLYKKRADYIESYAFATSKENTNITNIYISEIDVLEHFISYFRSKISCILTNSVEKEIILPFSHDFSLESERDIIKKQFLQNTPINNFYLRVKGMDISITKREKECLSFLSLGKKPKEIARLLGLSSRTVESYIEHVKIKTNSHSTSQLIGIYQENGT